jgi:hypothetical protein
MDGREVGGWDGAPEGVRFSQSATNFIGLVAVGKKLEIVTADKVFGPFDTAGDMTAISPDGTRFAFVSGPADTVNVVTESGAGPPLKSVDALQYSKSGRHLAYSGLDRAGKPVVVLDGKLIALPGALDRASFGFDSSERLQFTLQRGGTTDYYEDGKAVASLKGSAVFLGRLPSGQAVLAGFDARGAPIVAAGGAQTSARTLCDTLFAGNAVTTAGGVVLVCRKGDRLNRVRID